jgi:hypothetical protein
MFLMKFIKQRVISWNRCNDIEFFFIYYLSVFTLDIYTFASNGAVTDILLTTVIINIGPIS